MEQVNNKLAANKWSEADSRRVFKQKMGISRHSTNFFEELEM